MARRGKKSSVDVFLEIASKLPWWLSLVLAVVSYAALHAFANQPLQPIAPGNAAAGMIPAVIRGLASVGQYFLPILFCFAAVLSFFKRAKPVSKLPSISEINPSNFKTTNNTPACPVCSSSMVMRSAKKGSNAGSSFWGCSNYPKCKGTRTAG